MTIGSIASDMGIGLCLPCVLEHKMQLAAHQADKKAPPPQQPRFAVTQAPFPYPVPAPGGGIAGIEALLTPQQARAVGDGLLASAKATDAGWCE